MDNAILVSVEVAYKSLYCCCIKIKYSRLNSTGSTRSYVLWLTIRSKIHCFWWRYAFKKLMENSWAVGVSGGSAQEDMEIKQRLV